MRRHIGRCPVWLVTALACWSHPVSASGEASSSGEVVVDIRPESTTPAWVANALEQNIIRELLGYQHIRVMDKRDTDVSDCGDDACRLRAYGRAGVDIVLSGTASSDQLQFELFECWTPARITSGSFSLGTGTSMARLKQRILGAAAPFLRRGGLLEEKQYLTQRRLFPGQDGPVQSQRTRFIGGLFAAAALFFSLPLLLALVVASRRSRTREVRLRARRWSIPVVFTAAALAVHCWTDWLTHLLAWLDPDAHTTGFLQVLGAHLASWEWLIAAIGGVAWGAFGLLTLQTVFPPLGGMDRIAHRDVMRMLKVWLVLCLQRLLLLAVCYTPFALLAWWVIGWIPASQRLAVIVAAPLVGLLLRAWFPALVETCAFYLDERLVAGEADRNNLWHRDVGKYLQGYLNRTGWSVEGRLLESVLFLPAKSDEGLSYGGGGTHPRILIPRKLLQGAIGAPEELPPESSFVPWADALSGTVLQNRNLLPADRPSWVSSTLSPVARALGFLLRPILSRLPSRKRPEGNRSTKRKMLGQAATSLGYAVPFPPEELVPLIADGDEDFEIVRQLLAEHYAWFEEDPDDVSDDTDPTDQDFLFGVLVREIGRIQRQDSQLATIVEAIRQRFAKSPAWLRAAGRFMDGLYQRLFSRGPAMLTDGYTALNLARHHLIQYLYHAGYQQDDLLTARADGPELQATSNEIFKRIRASESDRLDRQRRRATLRNRLVWLSQFSHTGLEMPRRRWARILIGVVIGMSAAAGSFFLIKQAADYHPIYVQRIAEQQSKLEDSRRAAALEDKGNPDHEQ